MWTEEVFVLIMKKHDLFKPTDARTKTLNQQKEGITGRQLQTGKGRQQTWADGPPRNNGAPAPSGSTCNKEKPRVPVSLLSRRDTKSNGLHQTPVTP